VNISKGIVVLIRRIWILLPKFWTPNYICWRKKEKLSFDFITWEGSFHGHLTIFGNTRRYRLLYFSWNNPFCPFFFSTEVLESNVVRVYSFRDGASGTKFGVTDLCFSPLSLSRYKKVYSGEHKIRLLGGQTFWLPGFREQPKLLFLFFLFIFLSFCHLFFDQLPS
jgi:hypothetical protein